jgi:hypothetical protein
MANTACDLTEAQVLAALAIVATPVGAAALLTEWRERLVTAEEVAQVIAGSPRLQRNRRGMCEGAERHLECAHRGATPGHGWAAPVARPSLPEMTVTSLEMP